MLQLAAEGRLRRRAAQGAYGLGIYPQRLSRGTTARGHDGRFPGSYVRTAATRDGGRSLTFRGSTDALPDETLGTGLLEAEFCPSRPSPPAGRPEARQIGTMSGAPSRAASAVWSSG
ncbi:hypothetical protein ACTU45_06290 [Streptomyces sp. 24-1644]|uniref:hypothetical protein n=1 Tax=Streptomyces sp. 24-1644 TaxID=3457315 RepID=UPI003FA74C58